LGSSKLRLFHLGANLSLCQSSRCEMTAPTCRQRVVFVRRPLRRFIIELKYLIWPQLCTFSHSDDPSAYVLVSDCTNIPVTVSDKRPVPWSAISRLLASAFAPCFRNSSSVGGGSSDIVWGLCPYLSATHHVGQPRTATMSARSS